jgi:hypothetical protein
MFRWEILVKTILFCREEEIDFTRLGGSSAGQSAGSGQFYPEGAVVQLGCVTAPAESQVSAAWRFRCMGGQWKATFLRCDETGNVLSDPATAGT